MKIVITGGAGYVGIPLAVRLLNLGHDLTILDVLQHGAQPLIPLAANKHCKIVHTDIRGMGSDRAYWLADVDVIFHLAAISGYTACEADPGEAWSVNVDGTRNIVSALSPSQLLIYASTTSIYGPASLYAKTKEAAEQAVMARQNSISIRWATLFGVAPAMRNDLLPNLLVRQAIQRGRLDLFSSHQRRTFMHVQDAAAGYILAMDRADELVGAIWDVGDTGLSCTKRKLAQHIQEHVECELTEMVQTDQDARDIDVDFTPAADKGLAYSSQWSDHLPELVRLYSFYYPEG